MSEIESLDDLTAHPNNPNKGTKKGQEDYGAGRSILADKNGVIIAGNQTTAAAKKLGRKKVRVVQTTGDEIVVVQRMDLDASDLIAKGLAIADNRASELGLEWDPLALGKLDIKLDALFSEKDLRRIGIETPTIDAPEAQIDKADALQKKWQTERGQIWEIGPHRLMCGDCCTERFPGNPEFDLLFTDPPYDVDYEGNYIQSGKILQKKEKIWSGGIENDNRDSFQDWLHSAFLHFNAQMTEGCAIYCWHPPGASGKAFWAAWPWDEWHFQVDLIWNKQSLIIGRWDYKPQHEPCFYGWKGKGRKWVGETNCSTVWDFPRQQGASGETRNHPTQKPVALGGIALGNHRPTRSFDPFLGSGTTMCAAQALELICYGIEIEPKYVAVALERMSDMGLTPRLLTAQVTA